MPNNPSKQPSKPSSHAPNVVPAVRFSAPWGRQLKLITLLVSMVLFGVSALLIAKAPEHPPTMYQIGILIPPLTFILSALFTVRGYELQNDRLRIRRLGWSNRISLQDFSSATYEPEATAGSIRLFGNGGLFSVTGLFRNQKLGRYQAFVTDPAQSVVIRLKTRTLVVTPDRPQQFVSALAPYTDTDR
ncbi:PH domain-containing protein [Microbulbifer bruguierae]|uniref:PH domain-containing protein n=1 Tax=Microbulbifer bruguierae TaxID=3029061 RepID=A0ABY8NCT7_9GAMM|nr:PH domain-containing protein [Microbulbifer bruguierae]WGL16733.1 PH domain-containing protein [Microbulbifer bruguierae]